MKTNKERTAVNKSQKCGMITCIHCICNLCMAEKCDFYERVYCQED